MVLPFGAVAWFALRNPSTRKDRLKKYQLKCQNNRSDSLRVWSLSIYPLLLLPCILTIMVLCNAHYLELADHVQNSGDVNSLQGIVIMQIRGKPSFITQRFITLTALFFVFVILLNKVSINVMKIQNNTLSFVEYRVFDTIKKYISVSDIHSIDIVERGANRFSHNNLKYDLEIKTQNSSLRAFESSVKSFVVYKYIQICSFLDKEIDLDTQI